MADEDHNEETRSVLQRGRETWEGLPTQRRQIILGVAAAVLAGFAYLIYQGATAPDWQVVSRGMLPADQQAAVEALTAANIPYELGEGGTIQVPDDRIHEARLELAAGTMPSGRTVGFEIFDESELGQSTFNQKVNYHRALEGEMARTIRHLVAVKHARVHLVLPERRLFEEDEVVPTASVALRMEPGASLSRKQVQAIRHLVSGGVERLQPGAVSVVDQSGRMLAQPEDEDMITGEALQWTRSYQQAMERRIVNLLEPVVGRGRVRAQVAADVDFGHVVELEEIYDPESQVIRSERERTEDRVAKDNVAAGAPGTASNLPDRAEGTNAPEPVPAQMEKSDHIKNYEIDKTTRRRDTPQPRVEKLSVAVVVDAGTAGDGGEEPSPEQLTSYQNLVSRAAGIDTERGDAVEVIAMPFAGLEMEEPGGPPAPPLTERPMVRWGLIGGAVLLVAIIGLLLWRSRRKRLAREAEEQRQRLEEQEAEALPEPEPEIRHVQSRIRRLREKAAEQSREDVRRTAAVIRRWLREGEASDEEAA
ncbi:MAG: flagellar basal-body MS-ring/collar protein FliF [Myxococcota bacterium]